MAVGRHLIQQGLRSTRSAVTVVSEASVKDTRLALRLPLIFRAAAVVVEIHGELVGRVAQLSAEARRCHAR